MEAAVPASTAVRVTFRGKVLEVPVRDGDTMREVASRLEDVSGVRGEQQKLVVGKRIILPCAPSSSAPRTAEEEREVAACLRRAKKVMLLVGSSADERAAVRKQKEDATIRGFKQEEDRARQRVAAPPKASTSGRCGRFGDIVPLTVAAGVPDASEARALLQKLSVDPGIVHIMEKRNWRVGTLREIPPQGKVGISPVCLLGYNRNFGEEICLRLRTDDYGGFRKYAVIIATLLHELCHNVYADHDNNFKALNSELKREYDALHMRRIQTRTLHGEDDARNAPFFRGWDDAEEKEDKPRDGRRLGSL